METDSLPAVAIIIPFLNAATTLHSCLSAVCSLDYPLAKLQIVAVDNGSQDGSEAIVARFPRVKLLTEKQPGPYAARNLAVRQTESDILVFTDSDCVPARDWLLRLLEPLMEPSPVRITLGQSMLGGGRLLTRWLNAYERAKIGFITQQDDLSLFYGYTNNMAVSRATFLDSGPFDTVVRGADSALVQRVVWQHGAESVAFCAEACVLHLEVSSLLGYTYKMFLYGKSLESNRKLHPRRRRLSGLERREIYQKAVSLFHPSTIHRFCLGCSLLPPAIAFECGRAIVRWGWS